MDQYGLASSGDRDGLWDWSLASNRIHFSPRWISLVGCEDHEVGNSPEEWLRRVHPEDQERVRREIELHLAGGAAGFEIDHRILHKNGTYRWMACRAVVVRDDSGQAIRMMGSHSDVTAEHVSDPLTGLPNRLLFIERLTRSIERSKRQVDALFAVLLLDLDRQALPEEPAGSTAGNPLLTAAARRLETCLRGEENSPRPGDDYVVARLRGDQFAVLLEGLNRVGEAQMVAERVLADMRAPFQPRGHQAFLRASIGIAVSVTGYARAEDVLRDADAALYRARSLGGNRCEVFDTAILESTQARLQLEADLELALERREFFLVYQPILSLVSNQIVGLEALARWQHPTRGLISPLEFIPIAEETGIIVALGNWVLREACLQLKAWQESLPIAKDLWVSVNLSGLQFTQPGLVDEVSEALRDVGLEAPCLMLELTEGVVMENPLAARSLLMQLRVMGVRIGLDDFGTGHSSFAYLHQFPADFLKIDRSFVLGIEARQDKASIVGTLAGLARQLGLRVIAEGIETEEQLAVIRSLRCECGQGFLFSRPVDSATASDLLRSSLLPLPGLQSGEDLPDARERKRFSGQRVYLYIVLGAVALLVSVPLVARFARESDTPVPSSPPRVVGAALPSVTTPPSEPAASPTSAPTAPKSAEAEGVSGAPAKPLSGAPAKPLSGVPVMPLSEVPAMPLSEVPAMPLVSADLSLLVVHQHVVGSCRGLLNVSLSGVSFVPEKGKDAFTLQHGQFLSTLTDDTLTIKSDNRTYRFKAANVAGKDEKLSLLSDVLATITRLRPK